MRTCAGCEKPPKTPRSKWCEDGDVCRKRAERAAKQAPAAPAAPVCTKVSDALLLELGKLQMVDTYEGQVAMGLAAQLDDGSVRGAAYASLSKELDRRVDALRLKAELPDDPVRLITGSVEDRRANLRLA